MKRSVKGLSYIVICTYSLELLAVFAAIILVIKRDTYTANAYFSIDALGAILIMILAVVSTMASWYSIGYIRSEVDKKVIRISKAHQYFILLHLFIFAMFFAIITTSPILMWIAIEATTLSTAFLVSFYSKPSAVEAAWKYLIINSIGVLLGFFGTLLFLYPTVHSGFKDLMSWQMLLSNASAFDPFIAKVAFIFVLIGYGTKVGLVPMHSWLPDAHSKAPSPISSLLSGALLNVAFFAILRFKSITDLAISPLFSQKLLIFFGILSIVVAAFIVFVQKHYKRLLAYSSVEHMGIIALGFGFGGIGTFAALMHMIYHSLAKSALFLLSGNVFIIYGSTKMAEVRGTIKTLPITSVLLFIGFLAIIGVPPFGIFITEFTILLAGINAHPFVTIIAIFSLALVFAAIIKQVVLMIFGEPENNLQRGEMNIWTLLPPIILTAILVALSFFVPLSLQSLLQSATMKI
jgi:hydrogenase-4 component F